MNIHECLILNTSPDLDPTKTLHRCRPSTKKPLFLLSWPKPRGPAAASSWRGPRRSAHGSCPRRNSEALWRCLEKNGMALECAWNTMAILKKYINNIYPKKEKKYVKRIQNMHVIWKMKVFERTRSEKLWTRSESSDLFCQSPKVIASYVQTSWLPLATRDLTNILIHEANPVMIGNDDLKTLFMTVTTVEICRSPTFDANVMLSNEVCQSSIDASVYWTEQKAPMGEVSAEV